MEQALLTPDAAVEAQLMSTAGPPVEFEIVGRPVTWSRMRRNRYGASFIPADREAHMAAIRDSWLTTGREAFHRDEVLLLETEFVFDRSRSHFGSGKNRNRVLPSAPVRPGKNCGDLDNLVKIVKDALNSIAFHDDSQIAFLVALKRFAEGTEMPRTRVLLRAL
jgi:Holliday junction resolvase RusA-like endonuclease